MKTELAGQAGMSKCESSTSDASNLSPLTKRIVLFDDRYFEVYGAQENLLILAECANARGINLQLWTTSEGLLAESARARGITVRIVEAPESLRVYGKKLINENLWRKAASGFRAIRYSRQLHAAFVESKVDLVVASAIRSSLLMTATRLTPGIATLLFAQNSTPFGVLAGAAAVGMNRIALISRGSITTFPSWAQKLFARRIVVMPSGRDLRRYTPSSDHQAHQSGDHETSDQPVRIVSVCGISERKGLHHLIDAIAMANSPSRQYSLAVVGGPINAAAEDYARQLLEQAGRLDVMVDWQGWRDDIRESLAAADIFALASSHEGLPGVIIEAMAAGLPVVTTDAGGCAEIVRDNSTGIVVPVGNVAALSAALIQLHGADERTEMGRLGRDRVNREFTTDAFWNRFEHIVESTLTGAN